MATFPFLLLLGCAAAGAAGDAEPLYAFNSMQLAWMFDAAARRPQATVLQPPALEAVPFVLAIPPVPPASFTRTFSRLAGQRAKTGRYDVLIAERSRRYGLDSRLVKSIVAAESEFTPNARSPAGALGLMQVMPATALWAAGVGPKALLHPAANIEAGTAYLAYLFQRAWRRYHLRGVPYSKAPAWLLQRIVAAYNAGPRFLARRRLYRETRDYVRKVLLYYRSTVAQLL